MAREIINPGSAPNLHDGEDQHEAWNKINRMTVDLYQITDDQQISIDAVSQGVASIPAGQDGIDGADGIQGPQGIQGNKGDPGQDATAISGLLSNVVAREYTGGPFPTDVPEDEYMFDVVTLSLYRANEFAGSFATIDTEEFIEGMRLEVNDKSYYWDKTQFVEILGGSTSLPTTPIGKVEVEVARWAGDEIFAGHETNTFTNDLQTGIDFTGTEYLELVIASGGYAYETTGRVRMAALQAAIGTYTRGAIDYGAGSSHALIFGLVNGDLTNLRIAGKSLQTSGGFRLFQIRGLKYVEPEIVAKGEMGDSGQDGKDGVDGSQGSPGEDLSGNTARVDTIEARAENLELNQTAFIASDTSLSSRITVLENGDQKIEGTTSGSQITSIPVTIPAGKKLYFMGGLIDENAGRWIGISSTDSGIFLDWLEDSSRFDLIANNSSFYNRPYRIIAHWR